jgi:hypothetical protein
VVATRTVLVALARFGAAFGISLSTAAPVRAADWSLHAVETPATFSGDFAVRFWFGRSRTAKDLYDDTGTLLVSRLTYKDMSLFTGEAFSRLDFNTGWYVKGYAGGGALVGGRLKDEDFPPVIDPYSATLSDQREGSMIYGSVDAGLKVVRGPDFHVGVFAGYHFLRETVLAFGCGQVAANPFVCAGGIPDSINVITQVNNWHSLRVGVDAAVEVGRVKLAVDAAWLPYVVLYGKDAHWLRIDPATIGAFTGPVPEDGNGWGYQIEGVLSYQVNNALSVGVGGRYWYAQTKGYTHFEGHVVGFNALPQVVKWKVENFGVFVQTNVKLGSYPVIARN